MTLALLALAAVLVALCAYRGYTWFTRDAGKLGITPQALMEAPEELAKTGHMVFAEPLEHNEHGFITSPLVDCKDPRCPCRSMGLGGPTP